MSTTTVIFEAAIFDRVIVAARTIDVASGSQLLFERTFTRSIADGAARAVEHDDLPVGHCGRCRRVSKPRKPKCSHSVRIRYARIGVDIADDVQMVF
jgi:hypothetical protein